MPDFRKQQTTSLSSTRNLRRNLKAQFSTAELGKVYLDLKVDLAVKQIKSLLAAK